MGEAAAAQGRRQRRLRNYLLDRRFQLKYSGYLVAIAAVLGIGLGLILWRTSRALMDQSDKAAKQGDLVVARGRELVKESHKVSEVVQMNIVKDPDYADSPGLVDAFKTDAKKKDAKLNQKQAELEQQAAALKSQSETLAARQRYMLLAVGIALLLLVLGVGLAGIVVTHKVAGPIFKMKRQIREVGEGKLKIPGKLRKGDELVDFFDAFESMVRSLRANQEREIEMLQSAIAKLEGHADDSALEPLRALDKEMKATLET